MTPPTPPACPVITCHAWSVVMSGAPVAYGHYQHNQAPLLKRADDPVIADPVTP
jgi:hypothetical protein